MKFWKFEYSGPEDLANCISNNSLPVNDKALPGLKDTYAYPVKSMRVGDGVVLATLVGDEAKFFAVGKVLAIASDSAAPLIKWKATTFTHFPDARGGLVNWQTKTAFEISPSPAKRYGLEKLIAHYLALA